MDTAIALESPRWNDLSTRMGAGGGGWVRDRLVTLSTAPSDLGLFDEMWPEVCSEDRTYEAAFAAVPYLVAFAQRVSRNESARYLIVVGLIQTHAEHVPDDLELAYRKAVSEALDLALDLLTDCEVNHTLRYLLAAVAAFRGRPDLADALGNLDAIQEPCPSCGTVVFPSELQRIVARDGVAEA